MSGGGRLLNSINMTQCELRQARYNKVVENIQTNQLNPSRHRIEEHEVLTSSKPQERN